MIYSKVPLSESALVSQMVLDYLNADDFLKPFYNQPNVVRSYAKLIDEKRFDESKRSILTEVFYGKYKNAGLSLDNLPKIAENIKLLVQPRTFTITTGHQLCLHGGPLFLTYKILTTVKLCSELKNAYPEHNFVPVLWLASEDHDFEEISNTHLFGKDIRWYKDSHHKPVGRLDLDGMIEDIENIEKMIGTNETGQKWIQIINEAYLKSNNLSEASIKIFTELFKDFGLLVLEPDQKELKQQFTPVMKSDLLVQTSYKAQIETDKVLEEKYKLQIHARETNFFYLHQEFGRRLIKKENDFYVLSDTNIKFTALEIEAEIDNYPERFSPNVNLRPLYQETILPNLAYIGGPAEVSYWLQLKSVFKAHQIQFPIIVLRAINVLVGKQLIEKIEKYSLKVSDFIGNENALVQTYLLTGKKFEFQQNFDLILNEFQVIIESSRNINNDVSKKFLETKLSLKNFFNQNYKDLKRSIEGGESEQIEKILKLRGKIYPKNLFQERVDTLLQHEVSCDRSLTHEILEQIDVFDPQINIIIV